VGTRCRQTRQHDDGDLARGGSLRGIEGSGGLLPRVACPKPPAAGYRLGRHAIPRAFESPAGQISGRLRASRMVGRLISPRGMPPWVVKSRARPANA
jgi:hypothetical protein